MDTGYEDEWFQGMHIKEINILEYVCSEDRVRLDEEQPRNGFWCLQLSLGNIRVLSF